MELIVEDAIPTGIKQEAGNVLVSLAEDGSFPMEAPAISLAPETFGSNLAEYMGDMALKEIGMKVIEGKNSDAETLQDMQQALKDGLHLLGIGNDDRLYFDQVKDIKHPILLKIVTSSQNKAYMELFPSGGPVRTKTNSTVASPELEKKANRVRRYMNWQLTEQMPEYEPDLDRMLFQTFYGGNTFRKLSFDASALRPRSEYLTLDNFIIDGNVTSLEAAERYSHLQTISKREMKLRQLQGMYRDIDLTPTTFNPAEPTITEEMTQEGLQVQISNSPNENFSVIEQHCYLDLEGFGHKDENGNPTGLPLPYIVSVEETSGQVLAIYRNWRENDPQYLRRQWFVHYGYLPGANLLCFGLLHLIGGLAAAVNATLRTTITAGLLNSFPGGFVDKRVKIKGGMQPWKLAEWRPIETYGAKPNEAFFPLPVKEPSQVLLALQGNLLDSIREYAGSAEDLANNAATYGPVGTILALLEQAEAPYSAIHKRLHRSQAAELKILAEINKDTLPVSEYVPYGAYGEKISAQDFDGVAVVPVSNPHVPTAAHRLSLLRAQMEMAAQQPNLYNLPALHRQANTIINPDTVDLIMAPQEPPPPPPPMEPTAEIAAVLGGQPVKAYPEQPHDAHVSVLSDFLTDPRYGGMLEKPQQDALKSLLISHLALRLRQEVEMLLGQALPQGPLPPQIQTQMTQAIAVAVGAIKVAGQDQIVAPEVEAQRIEQAKIETKQTELELRRDIHNDQMQFKKEELAIDTALEIEKLSQSS